MFRTGYILGRAWDSAIFLGLPFFAIAVALASYHWLPAMAWASIGLWITIPHHFATWLRTYGLAEDWKRWRVHLIVGPVVLGALTIWGIRAAPTTLLLLAVLWDHQHSIMQQHGLARIYDFKARTGAAWTGRYDLWLHWFLYVNMLLTAPLHTRLWVREAYLWGAPVTSESVAWLQTISWGATGLFVCFYLGQLASSLAAGSPLNPIKYLFIGASYCLWYATSWHTDSFLVFGIAHRMMHGVQYMAIVGSYLGHKAARATPSVEGSGAGQTTPPAHSGVPPRSGAPLAWLVKSPSAWILGAAGVAYVLLYQFLVMRPLDDLGFGVVNFMAVYGAAPPLGLDAISRETGYDLFAAMLIQTLPLTHYYFDSFIWKVRDAKVQQGL